VIPLGRIALAFAAPVSPTGKGSAQRCAVTQAREEDMTKKHRAAPAKPPKAKQTAAKKKSVPRKRSKIVERFEWQGITVSVSYEADWLGMSKELSQFATAHLEIEAVEPPKQPLPVTETGYRSHFVARGVVEQAGGAVAYTRAWLDQAAKAPAWKRREAESQQLCLL
jgi:hypothetical protein